MLAPLEHRGFVKTYWRLQEVSVKLRLRRIGKTHRPHYRVCVLDSRKPQGGAYIESIGHYDPLIGDDKKKFSIDKARAEYWLSMGAQPSATVHSFLRSLEVSGLVTPKVKRRRRKSSADAKKPSKESLARSAKKNAKKATRKAALAKKAASPESSESSS